ncbi:MAG: hypothetical protein K6U02_08635 [Firmicutes bacterium]|nr:hypothetical protein [Bacillota bacterium]
MKTTSSASALKKTVIRLRNGQILRGYLNPARIDQHGTLELLTTEGAQKSISTAKIYGVYFVREFGETFEPQRKTFLSRPKLPGLWVRIRHTDGGEFEGIIENDLLGLLDRGIQFTPPDLNGPCTRIYLPRSSVKEITVLGLIGVGSRPRRRPRPAAPPALQRRLFD